MEYLLRCCTQHSDVPLLHTTGQGQDIFTHMRSDPSFGIYDRLLRSYPLFCRHLAGLGRSPPFCVWLGPRPYYVRMQLLSIRWWTVEWMLWLSSR